MSTAAAFDDAAAACCVVLMAKAPDRGKRRLAAALGPRSVEAARHLYACALEDIAQWPGPVCLAPAEEADLEALERPRGRPLLCVLQPAGNLGRRIERVSAELNAAGHSRQIFVGSDCAELDPAYLHRAAAALCAYDVVLGPARDGGVVLMGSSRPWPSLESLPWSTAELGESLEKLCTSRGLRTTLLETRGDVDTLADLLAAGTAVGGDPRPARQAFRRWLAAQPEWRSR